MPDEVRLAIDTHEWEAMLAALPKRVARRAVRQALQAGGDVIAEAMVAEAPERTDTPTPGSDALPPGVLKDDIGTQVQIGTKYAPRVKVGCSEIATHVAWWVENGFDHVEGGRKLDPRRYTQKKVGTVTRHIDANPFMARAFDASIERATEVMLQNLGTTLGQDINDPAGDSGGEEAEGAE
jgi:HK97 gp10 family phage protein